MNMILDGKQMATLRKARLTAYIQSEKEAGREKKLAILLVGDSAPSELYAQSVQRVAASIGMEALLYRFSDGTPQAEIVAAVGDLNRRVDITGILPLLPLPEAYNPAEIINSLSPCKDVDGQTTVSKGRLFSGEPSFAPCTSQAVVTMLADYDISVQGKHVVIVGRSDVVGKPLIHLFLQKNATVTVCHSKTIDLSGITRQADILVAAVGKAGFVSADMVKDGAVLIDVGINRVDGKTVGDICTEATAKAAAYTPVPGGIGALVSTMILENTAYGIRE
ncbi:MAG: bifunctional 5,10-methylenetetrahydrofolate dehydrogenase/5,10-methenyltetrahydrofolate cyclohydrolase [Anaeroglobus sp.]|nr:bifunctional 5,10-methylenetetrahydrofolate dehydrogenase/5,10-methenyltetrahydrofolate cyclohydrolase [Anaeroglobus sp.]